MPHNDERGDTGMRPANARGSITAVFKSGDHIGRGEVSVQRRPRVADLEARIQELEAENAILRRRLMPHAADACT